MTDGKPPVQTKWIFFWLLLFGGIFAVLETVALTNNESGDTLSEVLRFLIYSVPWGVGIVIFIGFIGWFVPHILNRGKKEESDDRPE
jgi:ABC-type cobalamin transport system permease subunit